MARKPTGRPPGRPKTAEETVTVLARIPRSLGEQVKRYAARHRCSVAELIRDGLEWRIEQDTPGRPSRLPAPPDTDDLPSMPDNGDTGIQELPLVLREAIAAAVRETLAHVQSRPHGEDRESVIQQYPISVLQQETGESQPAAEALEPESARRKTPESRQPAPADDPVSQYGAGFDHEKFYLGRLCPKGHRYGDSGSSLLRKHNNGCRECENAQKRERRARQKAAQEG